MPIRTIAILGAFALVAGACVTVTGEESAAPDPDSTAASSSPTTASSAAPASASPSAGLVSASPSGEPVEETAAATDPATAAATGPATPAATDPATGSAAPTVSASPEPTPEPTPAEPSIGYIALDASQAYVQAISAGMREAAEAADVDLVECDAGWTRTGVRTCARRLAAAGVTGAISMQPFGDLAEEVCETLGNVPTIGVVYEQGPCQVSLLQVDQAESGRLAGAALGALASERWGCDVKAFVSLGSGADDPIGGARMEGYRAGFKEHCPMPKTKVRLSDTQHLITAQKQMAKVLDDIPGKKIIVAGVSDSAALGALQAAEQADRANHVWVAGQLAEPAAREVIACDDHFVASVAQFPDRFGEVAVPAIVAAMDGAEVPQELDAEMALVTADDVRELFPDTPACGA